MASSRSSSEPAAVAGRRPLAGARPALALVALAVLAFNLRTPTASLPPLLGDVQGALGLSGAATGLLTAPPVLCMALCAPAAQRPPPRGRPGAGAPGAAPPGGRG